MSKSVACSSVGTHSIGNGGVMLCLPSPPPGSLPCSSPWLKAGFSRVVAAQQLEVQEVITGADTTGCSAAGLGLGTLHRSVLSFGCCGGLSQVLLLLSEIKGSAIMNCWGWCLWTEPQLQLCSIFSVLMGTREPGQQALLLPSCAISSTQPAQAVISSPAQLAFAALWLISSCKTPA